MNANSLKNTVLFVGFIAILAVNVGNSLALADIYREGEPPTLSQPVAGDGDDVSHILGTFALSYKAAGRPRIALFWNRELTDQLSRKTEKVSKTTSRFNSVGSDEIESDLNSLSGLRAHASEAESVNRQAEIEYDDNQRLNINQKTNIVLRSTFRNLLASAGAYLVDRALMMRESAAKDNSRDTQVNEIKGLMDKADWLMEIIMVNDPSAPLHYGFNVSVKSLKDSSVIVEFYTQAKPLAQAKQPYVATANGFERATAKQPEVNDIGYNLGIEVMRQLAISM